MVQRMVMEGRFEDAERWVQKGIPHEPRSGATDFAVGSQLLMAQQPTAALNHLERAQANDPGRLTREIQEVQHATRVDRRLGLDAAVWHATHENFRGGVGNVDSQGSRRYRRERSEREENDGSRGKHAPSYQGDYRLGMRTGARTETPFRLTVMEILSDGFVPAGKS